MHKSVSRKVIFISCIVYVLYHIASLPYSPLPWFDEVCFASITQSYVTSGNFIQEVRSLSFPGPVLIYGPVYFVLQGLIAKAFGFGLFTFRITNMLFGFADVCLVYLAGRRLGLTARSRWLAVAIMMLDPAFNQNLHSGRMDLIALFFFLLAYLIFDKGRKKGNPYLLSLLSGIFLALAMLTTPRMVFAFPVFIVLFVYDLRVVKEARALWISYCITFLTCCTIFLIWVYSAFGSLNSFINAYTGSKLIMSHVGAGTNNIGYHFLLSLIALLIAAYALLKLKPANYSVLLVAIPALVGFHLIVKGSDVYYAMAIPFTALLLGWARMVLPQRQVKWIIAAIPVIFVVVFIGKVLVIFATIPRRDASYYSREIEKIIPKNAAVAGDFMYYYIAMKNRNTYQSTESNGTVDQQQAYWKQANVQYILINDRKKNRSALEHACVIAGYHVAAHIENDGRTTIPKQWVILRKIQTDYACSIYAKE